MMKSNEKRGGICILILGKSAKESTLYCKHMTLYIPAYTLDCTTILHKDQMKTHHIKKVTNKRKKSIVKHIIFKCMQQQCMELYTVNLYLLFVIRNRISPYQ